jgi:hypothetical protein
MVRGRATPGGDPSDGLVQGLTDSAFKKELARKFQRPSLFRLGHELGSLACLTSNSFCPVFSISRVSN